MQDLRVFVRVDNTTYSIVGLAHYPNSTEGDGVSANITNRVISPTRIITVATAGPMQVNLTFLNPVEVRFQPSIHPVWLLLMSHLKPGDWVKQSIPFSYISLSAASLDNAAHSIQVFSDISSRTKIVFILPTMVLSLVQGGCQTLLVCPTM